ncbi:hypothetical protein ACGFI9_37410 [Micromonospora sp. NPDC048930]|uniref:hypothetical protein n=1 Tax=Micromonospora sp. NPDC048930 TaxID=3364261 RepID=UPI0037164382
MSTKTTEQLDPEAPRDWHFTFGARQRFDGRYVTIHGTHGEARAEMIRHFGTAWCAMYDATRPADVTKFPTGLSNLPRAEWPDPTRPTVLEFGSFGIFIPTSCIDTPATATEIFEAIGDELTSAGYNLDTIALQFTDSGHAVEVVDDGALLGLVRISQREPDYWLTLADELRKAADMVATLAGTGSKPYRVALWINAALTKKDADTAVPIVDAVTAALGMTAEAKQVGSTWEYGASEERGDLKVWVDTPIPSPEDNRVAELEQQLEQLRAQLAQGGAAR